MVKARGCGWIPNVECVLELGAFTYLPGAAEIRHASGRKYGYPGLMSAWISLSTR